MQAIRWAVPLVICGVGCGGPNPDIPHVKPPVEAAVPTGLGGKHSGLFAPALDAVDIKQRFFTEGPTNVFFLLGLVDGQIDEVNSGEDCGNTPVQYTVHAWGHDVTANAKCSRSTSDGFIQWSTDDSGATDILSKGPNVTILAHIEPGGIAGTHKVHTWLAITGSGALCSQPRGSYGVIELNADESTGAFEMTVAGEGFGYCGAQLKSDGATVYVTGSADLVSSCNAVETQCGSASDIGVAATCGASVTTFALPPAGRAAAAGCGYGGSAYPGGTGNGVNLDGSAADSVQTFGPKAPTI